MNHDYINQQISNLEEAKNAAPIREYTIKKNDCLDSQKKLKDGCLDHLKGIENAIYIITQINGNIKATFDAGEAYKKKEERAFQKLNKESLEKKSQVLYVGSSTGKHLTGRIKQHINSRSKKIYALHLHKWFKGDYEITIQEYSPKIERVILQLIEDNTSYNENPIFGKMRSDNK